jgi:hypothetical protein
MSCVLSRVGQGPPFGSELPNSVLLPPLSFFPTSTVYSARHPAGLLHPASGHGVRNVSASRPTPAPEGLGPLARLPRLRFTLRSVPLLSRSGCVTALRDPLAVAPGPPRPVRPCCHVRARRLSPVTRPQGFAPLRSPLRPVGVATDEVPVASLGFVPRAFSMPVFHAGVPKNPGWRALAGPKTVQGLATGSGGVPEPPEGCSFPLPGIGPGAIPPPREGLGGRRLPRRRSEELRADAAPAASDLSAGPKVGGRAALGAVLPKELVSAGWGPRSALRRGRLLGPEGGGSSLPKGGWACLGVPPGPPLWRRWCRRGLFRRPRRVGGSARLGAVGWGLRRVPRPPARGAGSDLSSASFFICLRRASDSWDSRGRRPKLVVSRDPARVSPGAEAPVRRRRSGGGCGARGAGPAWCVAWLVPKHQNLGPKPGAAVPCGTRRSLGDAALTPPLLVGGLWFLPRHEPRAASAAWGQPLPAWAEARAGGGPMKIEPLSCHVKDRFRRLCF